MHMVPGPGSCGGLCPGVEALQWLKAEVKSGRLPPGQPYESYLEELEQR